MRCEFCGAEFNDRDSLQLHNLTSHAGRPYPARCDVCGQTFESPAELKAHNESVHRTGRS